MYGSRIETVDVFRLAVVVSSCSDVFIARHARDIDDLKMYIERAFDDVDFEKKSLISISNGSTSSNVFQCVVSIYIYILYAYIYGSVACRRRKSTVIGGIRFPLFSAIKHVHALVEITVLDFCHLRSRQWHARN
jgi:hypothetical protein